VSIQRLKQLLQAAVTEGEVVLSSGKTSDFYIDGRLVTLDPVGSLLAARAILDAAKAAGATAVGGPTVAACPLVSAVGVLAAQEELPLKLFYVRSKAKGHGLQKAIEGPALTAGDKALVVDDTMTSGGSLLRAVEQVRAETEAEVLGVLCLVDREEGGVERLEAAGIRCQTLFTRADLTQA